MRALSKIADTDAAAIAEIYDQHAVGMFRYARAIIGSDDDAEDAVCEVFFQLTKDAKRLERLRDVKRYLLRATRNAVYRIFRDAGRREELAKNSEWHRESQASTDSDPNLDCIMGEFGELPAEQRDVLALKLLHGLTFREIGEMAGLSQNTVASRYRYGIDRLRAAVKESDYETGTD
jgi:RNA polymerase sigma-70 factor, ECF subfamily